MADEIITSRQNRLIVDTVKLDDKRERDARRLFRFDGVKLLCEAVKAGVEFEYIIISESAQNSVFERAWNLYGISRENVKCRQVIVGDQIFEKISSEKAPEGVICVAKYIDKFHKIATIYNSRIIFGDGNEMDLLGNDGILLLESVRDPVNVGAIIRSAAALGAGWLVLSSDCADIYNSRAVRGAMGTLFSQRIIRTSDMVGFISALRSAGRRVFAAALDKGAEKLGDFEVIPGDCAVIGNEGHGLSREVIGVCTGKVFIPMRETAESLNAGVAASIFLWEICRGR